MSTFLLVAPLGLILSNSQVTTMSVFQLSPHLPSQPCDFIFLCYSCIYCTVSSFHLLNVTRSHHSKTHRQHTYIVCCLSPVTDVHWSNCCLFSDFWTESSSPLISRCWVNITSNNNKGRSRSVQLHPERHLTLSPLSLSFPSSLSLPPPLPIIYWSSTLSQLWNLNVTEATRIIFSDNHPPWSGGKGSIGIL